MLYAPVPASDCRNYTGDVNIDLHSKTPRQRTVAKQRKLPKYAAFLASKFFKKLWRADRHWCDSVRPTTISSVHVNGPLEID